MKKIFYLSALSLFILSSCGPKMSPVEYNDVIIGEQTKMSQLMIEMTDEFQTFNFDKSDEVREKLVQQCEASVKAVKELPDYKGNTRFRDAGAALFGFYRDISDKEYKEMIDILKKGADITEDDIMRLTVIEQEIGAREEPLDNEFQAAQEEFATEHNISLIENKIQKDIDKLGE